MEEISNNRHYKLNDGSTIDNAVTFRLLRDSPRSFSPLTLFVIFYYGVGTEFTAHERKGCTKGGFLSLTTRVGCSVQIVVLVKKFLWDFFRYVKITRDVFNFYIFLLSLQSRLLDFSHLGVKKIIYYVNCYHYI